MLHLHLHLLSKDRAGLIEGLQTIIEELETACTYVMSSDRESEYLLTIKETDQTDLHDLVDQPNDQILNRRGVL